MAKSFRFPRWVEKTRTYSIHPVAFIDQPVATPHQPRYAQQLPPGGSQGGIAAPGRQVGDPYQAQKLLACSNQWDTTYSPFTLTYYLRPRRWAMPDGLGTQCIGTRLVASLSAAQFSPPLVSSMYQVGRVREPTYWYKPRSVSVCRH